MQTIIILVSLSFIAYTQKVGYQQFDYTFTQADFQTIRTFYLFVPWEYDQTKSYPLIVGFRGGPHSNAGQFRYQLQFLSDQLDAIVFCPENIENFNVDENDVKKLYKYSLEKVTSDYNIDENRIYLTGLSFGGRHAVLVGLDTDAGDIPKIRGLIPFATGRNAELLPNYENADQFPPTCLCIGLSDNQLFIDVANTLYDDISSAGGKVFLNEIPGVGHKVDFDGFEEEMTECLNFIESQYTNSIRTNSGELIKIYPNPSDKSLIINSK